MAQNPLGGFLKGLFGRPTPNPAPQALEQAPVPPASLSPTVQVSKAGRRSSPATEAYLSRKKGRKLYEESYADAKKLHESIQRRGEASPGDLAQEMGMARSSLAYHLNRLAKKGYIERIGGGRSIRYRVTGVPLGRID